MALHRDIFWVGRQWAVTGFGVQAIDQRLKGAFDIEASRLWEDDLPQRMGALAWINVEDFTKALDVARARLPEPPPKKSLPLVESVLELLQSPAPERPKLARQPAETGPKQTSQTRVEPAAIELPKPKFQPLAMQIGQVSAKFLPRWRIRH